MVIRFTVFMGLLLGVLSWVLLVPLAPEDFQAPPSGPAAINDARGAGLLPEPGQLRMSGEIGHEVFEVPAEDAEHLAMVMANGGGMAGMEGMAGMQMGEMKDGEPMPGMQMGEMKKDEPMPGMQMGEMKDGEPMAGMQMGGEAGHGAEEAEGGGGLTIMAAGMAGMAGRTVEVEMREWGFSPAGIEVKAGETIRFVVSNKGNMPHEFMFMPGSAMQAVNYRLERADWNLLEHEAPFEQAIVLPGDSFEVVIRIDRPGMWMYMCMFPYHMQFGMMGMMATQGMSMDMGGMKM